MNTFLRNLVLLTLMLFFALPVGACITCNQKTQQAIFESAFYPNLLAMLSPFIVLALVVGALSVVFKKQHAFATREGQVVPNPVPLTTAALVLGIGAGGFVDGIVLHQLLQWHEMLSNKIPPTDLVNKSVNMFWDGVFHLFCLLVVLAGVVMLWQTGRRQDADRSGRLLWGGLIGGWGVFNILEGILDHHVLKLHNVREITGNVAAWNYGFLIFSVLLVGIGWRVIRSK